MAWPPDVVQGRLRITETGDDGAPCVVLVVQQVRRVGRLPEVGDLAQAKLLVAVFVPRGGEVPRVDHVRDHLFFVRCVLGDRVARTHENPDVPVVPLRAALRHERHELQPPAPRVAGGASGDHVFILIGEHQHGQADLLEVVEADGGLPLLLGLGQRGQQHRGEDGDDRDHHEQLDQREGASCFGVQIHVKFHCLAKRFAADYCFFSRNNSMSISLESRKPEWPSRKSMFEPLPLCRLAAMRRSLLRRLPLAS